MGLKELLLEFNLLFEELLGPNGLGDVELIREFPETTLASNYIQNVQKKFTEYTNVATIPVDEIQKILKYVDGTRQFLRVIQTLNNPQFLIAFVNRISGDSIKDLVAELDKSFKPEKFAEFIKDILKEVDKLVAIGNKITGYINLGRNLVKLMLLLIKVFVILIAAIDFIATAIPAIFTTAGIPVKFSTIKEDILKRKGLQKFIKRLNQINIALGLMSSFVRSLVSGMNNIRGKLNLILVNLESCSRKPDDLIDKLKSSIDNIDSVVEPLQEFLDGIDEASKEENNIFGSYTIKIVQEEVTDEGISLRRRYGIAVGNDGSIAATSTPTFASLDIIIINEVKVQLISQGLVEQPISSLSPEDSLTVIEATKFLGEDEKDLNVNVEFSAPEDVNNDIQEFASNLPGGRALRIRTRKKLIKQNQKITADLKKADPNGKFNKDLIQQKDAENVKLQIDNLEDEKKGLKIKLIAAAAIPGAQLALVPIIKRIKEIDDELVLLRSGRTPMRNRKNEKRAADLINRINGLKKEIARREALPNPTSKGNAFILRTLKNRLIEAEASLQRLTKTQ